MRHVLIALVAVYRRCISPWKPRCCRFEPTCSLYAQQALHAHGVVRGGWLAVRRLARCHPFCEPGFDPVPARKPMRGPLTRTAS